MYKVWCPCYGEDESDADTILAPDPLEAAEEWAEVTDNQGDYTVANSGSTEVLVRDIEKDKVYEVTIYAEPSTMYSATLDRKGD